METFVTEVEKLNTLSYQNTLNSTRSLINQLMEDEDYENNNNRDNDNDDSIIKSLDSLSTSITKELKSNHSKLNKFNRALEKNELNLSDYYKHHLPQSKSKLVLNAVNLHLLRVGKLDQTNQLGMMLSEHYAKINFSEMKYLQGLMLKEHNLEKTIEWFYANQGKDSHHINEEFENVNDLDKLNDLDFEFKLHKLNYLKLQESNGILKPFKYSQSWFPKLMKQNSKYINEISKMVTELLLATPSSDGDKTKVDLDADFKELGLLFSKKYCANLGIEYESFLFLLVLTGFISLPNYVKFQEKFPKQTSLTLDSSFEIPFSIELPPLLKQYHPIFICPVSKEETSDIDNPPYCLPCHHIISRISLNKISKNGLTTFKCPYCPTNCNVKDCKLVKFHFI